MQLSNSQVTRKVQYKSRVGIILYTSVCVCVCVCVGSRSENNEWWDERGPHGHGILNEAGRELLSFCSVNEATVCNTWFQKKAIYKQTWQHPKSKRWLDYAIVRRSERWRCLDVAVKRGAVCNSDHMMLWMKLKVGKKLCRNAKKETVKRFNVAELEGHCVDVKGRELPKGRFVSGVSDRMTNSWNPVGSVQKVMRDAMCSVAKSILGVARGRKTDWFRESGNVLRPLFEERSRTYAQWLSSGKAKDKKKLVKARSVARKAVRDAKNGWFQRKAMEASARRNGGKVVWKCIKDIQRSRRGLAPMRVTIVKDEDGNPCTTPDSQQQRWQRHFEKVLNVQSMFSEAEVTSVWQRPVREEMAEVPSEEEVLEAVMKMKNGKTAGESEILSEMVKAACCSGSFVEILMELVSDVWAEGKVPADWSDAMLVPIPKKGDLTQCDNWRGIALLDVVGKVVSRVIQGRLQKLAEDELPESQCGFRKGRGCVDMVFAVRQLLEKSWEHRERLFITFVDLRKAYDSEGRLCGRSL